MKWEYLYLRIEVGAIERELNELGEQGWELVSQEGLQYFFFKRPKPGQRAAD
jgi:hypothetical protein